MEFGKVEEQAVEHYVNGVTRASSTASGVQVVTGVGFRPKGVIFFTSGGSHPACSIGGSDGTVNRCLANNHAETAEDWQGINNAIRYRYSGADRQEADIQSFDADGFTLIWSKFGSPTGETASIFFMAMR